AGPGRMAELAKSTFVSMMATGGRLNWSRHLAALGSASRSLGCRSNAEPRLSLRARRRRVANANLRPDDATPSIACPRTFPEKVLRLSREIFPNEPRAALCLVRV